MSGDARNFQKYPPILFDEARRREFVNPDNLIELIAPRNGDRVADFGAGAGFFAIPLAKAVKPRGRLYAIDINPNNLSIIRGKAKLEKVERYVELVEANVESGAGLELKAASLDAVVMSSVLSQFEDKDAVIGQAVKLLKPHGYLVVFEWHQRDMLLGPAAQARIAKEEVINRLFKNGWKVSLHKDVDVGFYHYCLIFTKE